MRIPKPVRPPDARSSHLDVLDPLPPMLEIFAGDGILAAQKGASDTAVDAVVDTDLGRIEQKPAANAGHGRSPRNGGQAGSKCEQMNTYVQMYTYVANAVESCQVIAKSRKAIHPKLPNNP
jgi:hypothetical protein